MRTHRLAVVCVTVLLLIVLVGHVCPLGVTTLDGARAVPVSAPHGPGGHHEHHETHLSACLPGAILPASGMPSLGAGAAADSATAVMATVAIAARSVPREPTPDPPRLKPPLYLLHTVLLI